MKKFSTKLKCVKSLNILSWSNGKIKKKLKTYYSKITIKTYYSKITIIVAVNNLELTVY